jgi:serine/threonine-protein kinase
VIAQDPADGKRLKEEATVTITVSLGNTLVAVPTDLGGKPVDAAAAELQQLGLVLGTQTEQNDETVPPGVVISADPTTPPQLAKGEAVNVIVSKGPAPRTVPAIPPTATFEAASKALTDVQLVPARRDEISDTVPEGQIIGTDPPAGASVARDSTVTVIVSKGLPTIPDVANQSVADATAALQAAGFTVSGVQGNPSRTVVGTNPPAGTRAASGTGVTLITRS